MSRATRVIRRKESFNKMDQLVGHVERWFFTSGDLARVVTEFVKRAAGEFVVDPAGGEEKAGEKGWWLFSARSLEEKEVLMGVAVHRMKELHEQYENTVEGQLLKYLEVLGVTEREFREVCALSEAEEERCGSHFYRWHYSTKFENFSEIVCGYYTDNSQLPMTALRRAIETISETARVNYRRRKKILPVIDKWDLSDFSELLEVLEDAKCPKPRLKVKTKKELARWRIAITKKQQSHGGVYTAPEADRGEWAKYIAHITKFFETESEFLEFHEYLLQHVDSIVLGTEARRCRRLAWEAFYAMDEEYSRAISVETVTQHLDALGPLSKSDKKIIAACAAECQDHTSPTSKPLLTLPVFRQLISDISEARGLGPDLFESLKTKAREHHVE